MEDLLNYVHQVATGEYICSPHRLKGYPSKLKKSISELTNRIKSLYPDLPNANWVALRLLEGDQTIIDSMKKGEIGKLINNPENKLVDAV